MKKKKAVVVKVKVKVNLVMVLVQHSSLNPPPPVVQELLENAKNLHRTPEADGRGEDGEA